MKPQRTYESIRARLPMTAEQALTHAARMGDLPVVKAVLNEGMAAQTIRDALTAAAECGHLDVVRCIYSEYVRDNDASAAVSAAAMQGHLDIVRYLCEQGGGMLGGGTYALRNAAGGGYLDIVKYLHGRGAAIDDQTVAQASVRGPMNLATIQYLHQHGADIKNDYMIGGMSYDSLDVIKYLYAHSADIRAAKDVCLHYAAEKGCLTVVEYLHAQGADIRAYNDSALRRAASNGHLAVVEYLHAQGADIREDDDDALRGAARNGHLAVVEYLHAQGADSRRNNDWALDLAALNGHLAVVKYLHAQGLPVDENIDKQIKAYDGWIVRHGRCPRGIGDLTPFLFRAAAFDDVTGMIKQEGYNDVIAHKYAYHAAGLFGTTDRVLAYLEKWGIFGRQPLHDVIQHISLPQGARFNHAAWGDACLRHGPKMARLVKFADKLPEPLKDSRGQWSYSLTRAESAKNAYERGDENPELAALCFENDWTEKQFEKALKLTEKYQARYAGNDNDKPGGRVPAVTIDGADFGRPGYLFSKLPDGDARGLLLGEFTNCCQHLAGEGSACAEHGFLSPQGGFYVVTGSDGKIVAQSWAWRGKKDELVLDSLESLSGHMTAPQWRSLCDEFARQARADKTAAVTAVHIGTGGATPDRLGYKTAATATPRDYNGYRDSQAQYAVPVHSARPCYP